MRKRFARKASARRFAGGVWIEGESAQLAVATGPAERDRNRLLEIVECATAEVPSVMATIEETLRLRDSAEVEWVTALRGAGCLVESRRVPREVAHAPAETRALACLAGTPWGDPDMTDAMQLALGFQIDGDRCHIAAAPVATLLAARDAVPSRSVRVTCEAIAFAHLVLTAHPAIQSESGSAALALFCSERSGSVVVFESGELALARQIDLDDALRRQATRRQKSTARAQEPSEFDTAYTGAFEGETSWRESSSSVDSSRWRAAMLGEIRESLALYREAGGYAGDITTVFVAGEAAERHELRFTLPQAFGCEVDVIELEASRVISSDDPDVARRVAESEASLVGVLALLAAARRQDLLAFPVGLEDEVDGETQAQAHRLRGSSMMRALRAEFAVAAALFLAIVAVAGGLRAWQVDKQTEEARRELAVELDRAEQLRAIAAERAENQARFNHTEELVRALDSLKARQRAPLTLLSEVGARLPRGAGLSEVTLDRSDVTIAGASENADDAMAFALNLQQAGDAFTDVTPATEASTYERQAGPSAPGQAEERPLVKFTVRARFLPALADAAEAKALNARPAN